MVSTIHAATAWIPLVNGPGRTFSTSDRLGLPRIGSEKDRKGVRTNKSGDALATSEFLCFAYRWLPLVTVSYR